MAAIDTVFVDHYYDVYDEGTNTIVKRAKDVPGIDMQGYVNIPKRTYYSFRNLGWKGFNGKLQSWNDDFDGFKHAKKIADPTRMDFTQQSGGKIHSFNYNPITNVEDQEKRTQKENIEKYRCGKFRYMYATIMAVEDNSDVNMNFMLDLDSVPITDSVR